MNYSYIFNHIKSKLSTSIWLKLFIFFKAIILLHENNKELFTNTLLTSTRLQNIINVKGSGKREVVIVLIGGLALKHPFLAIDVYACTLIYSSILRIRSSFKESAIIYIK